MLKSFIKIASRNLIRHKAFSVINIAGLALAIASSMLILLWVWDETQVDNFHANGENLYQVYERRTADGKMDAGYETQGLLADELKRVIPEIKNASSLGWNESYTFQHGQEVAKLDGTFAGADFFTMFSYPLIEGTPATALASPDGIAISRKAADQFFGNPSKAIGKSIRFENKEDLTVTAVFENLPSRSSQQFNFLRTWEDFVKTNDWVNNWRNTNPFTFVQLREGTDPARLEAKIKDFTFRYKPKTKGTTEELALQAFREKYLYSNLENGRIAGGRIEYVRLFTFVALLILSIACINFMNLATARSAKRAKEVGVRKAIGADRSSLIGQFIGEAIMLTFFATVLAAILVLISLPLFNSYTGKTLSFLSDQPTFWIVLSGLLVFTGMVSGSYPALFLSALNPVRILKGNLRNTAGKDHFRKSLVVLQFGLSILMVSGMIVINRQLGYIHSKNIGYNRENLIYIPLEGNIAQQYEVFKQELSGMPGILAVSRMRGTPTVISHSTGDFSWPGKNTETPISIADETVGYDFAKTMGLQLKDGRDFDKSFGSDSAGFLVNETAAKMMGYHNAVDQPLAFGAVRGKIIGVIKDFHFSSMHQAIEPLILRFDEKRTWGTILVRAEAGKTEAALAGMEKIWKQLNPNFPLKYEFSDQAFTKLYRSEQVAQYLGNCFAMLAIFISSLGLFGLAMSSTEQRTKEIGVRKVLGASVGSIVSMMTTDLLKPVGLATLVMLPISWFLMNQWLSGFAYKIAMDWSVFAVAGVVTLGIALLTVSLQSIKASLVNPVISLRSE